MTSSSIDEHRIPEPEGESPQSLASRELSSFEVRQYEDEIRRQWDTRIFTIKLDYLNVVSGLGLMFLRVLGIALLLIVLYLIVLILVHYTYPSESWLKPEELSRLENIYGRAAGVSAPIMLITNAWIIWWMSRTRRGR